MKLILQNEFVKLTVAVFGVQL